MFLKYFLIRNNFLFCFIPMIFYQKFLFLPFFEFYYQLLYL
ncbi:hypothetical protein ANASTE_00681 [Anaerofustis stercorihominis DSM 17244]|uniref:Uncharacterized protein n=1 Tax=Anaerofustis stercorihominis DSM 17244 TaxID=445971 RepID=B1C7H9_9FIRM|nr:hypothetical protein ANASTE_00681 [Anaerofustis stercorihominis DSM 17244]